VYRYTLEGIHSHAAPDASSSRVSAAAQRWGCKVEELLIW
jgi:hypothetical protein